MDATARRPIDPPQRRLPRNEDAEFVHRDAQPVDAADLLDRVRRRGALGDAVTVVWRRDMTRGHMGSAAAAEALEFQTGDTGHDAHCFAWGCSYSVFYFGASRAVSELA